MIEVTSIAFLTINAAIYLILILLWKFNFKSAINNSSSLPIVSIIVACRNESKNIHTLICCLQQLNYPQKKFEVLIGNDDSEDDTLEILKKYESNNIHVYDIKNSLNQLKGKMNVLAQLIQKSKGKYLFITDADMHINPNWLKTLISTPNKNVGMVTGYTKVENSSLFSAIQNVDYTIAQGVMKVISDVGITLFASGNNMMFSREAYESTGGYEKMDFHIIEDVLLMKEIARQGYQIGVEYSAGSTCSTQPITNLKSLINQRKRWMQGFSLLPAWVIMLSISKLFYLPLTFFLLFRNPIAGISFLFVKIVLTTFFSISINNRVNGRHNFLAGVLYEFYELIIYIPALILHWFSNHVNWKGRKLKHN